MHLRLTEQLEDRADDRDQPESVADIELAKKYYLVTDEQMRMFTKARPAIEQILDMDKGLRRDYTVDPLTTRDVEEHVRFAKYLREQILRIDVYDAAEPENTYGTARVPLVRLLRQGQPSVVLPFQFDLYEPRLNTWVGALQMLITNEGQRVEDEDLGKMQRAMTLDRRGMTSDQIPASAPSVQVKTIKKVFSKPLDTRLKD